MGKKYSFSKASHIFDWAFVVGFTLLVFALVLFVMNNSRESKLIMVVSVAALLPMMVKHSKRKIIVFDDHLEFTSYHIDKKYQDGKLNYEEIKSISKCSCIGDISRWGMKIESETFSEPIKIEASINDCKELFGTIIEKSKLYNPNVSISDEIMEYVK